jgi:hypothetical protein
MAREKPQRRKWMALRSQRVGERNEWFLSKREKSRKCYNTHGRSERGMGGFEQKASPVKGALAL